jgi:murein DD-endopeptidase MepM/ murein hydrolase activator NlpD
MARILQDVEAGLWRASGPAPHLADDLVILAGQVERAIRAMGAAQTRLEDRARVMQALNLRLGYAVRTLSLTYGLNPPPLALALTERADGRQGRMESAIAAGGASFGRVALTAAIGASSLAGTAKVGALPDPTQTAPRGGSVEKPFDVMVGPGDTLVKLSERYYGTASRALEIARMNGITDPDHIIAGTILTLPDPPSGGAPAAPVRPSQVVVQPGDTLRKISARVFGDESHFMDIARANGLTNPDLIVVGSTLTIPSGEAPSSGGGESGTSSNFRLVSYVEPSGGGSTGAGAPAAAAVPASKGFVWPARGVRPPGGEFWAPRPGRPSPNHTGLDMAATTGTPVVAAAAGTVTHAGWEGTYGISVVIDHGNGYVTRYAHLSKADARTGARVAQGQRIGAVGSTGYSTGPHLHFEVIHNGRFINPTSVLP